MIENDRRYFIFLFLLLLHVRKKEMYKLSFIITFFFFSLSSFLSFSLRKLLLDIIDEENRRSEVSEVRERRDVHSIHTHIYICIYVYVNVYCLYFRIKEKGRERERSVVHPSIHISNNLYIVRSKNNHKEENDNC